MTGRTITEKPELQKAYARLEDVRRSQEQFVKDMNSLADRPQYDHLVDLCYRHMKPGALQVKTLMLAKGFFRVELRRRVASDLLDLILENVQKGHYAMFATDAGAGFALSALPNSMRIHWTKVRAALLEAGLDGKEEEDSK